MSKAKHTAWKVKTNVHPETNGDPWGWVGRDVFGSGDAIPGVSITWTGAKGRGTARLIAASPELIEALKGLLSWSAHLPFAADDKVEFARDVIKKIEG